MRAYAMTELQNLVNLAHAAGNRDPVKDAPPPDVRDLLDELGIEHLTNNSTKPRWLGTKPKS